MFTLSIFIKLALMLFDKYFSPGERFVLTVLIFLHDFSLFPFPSSRHEKFKRESVREKMEWGKTYNSHLEAITFFKQKMHLILMRFYFWKNAFKWIIRSHHCFLLLHRKTDVHRSNKSYKYWKMQLKFELTEISHLGTARRSQFFYINWHLI